MSIPYTVVQAQIVGRFPVLLFWLFLSVYCKHWVSYTMPTIITVIRYKCRMDSFSLFRSLCGDCGDSSRMCTCRHSLDVDAGVSRSPSPSDYSSGSENWNIRKCHDKHVSEWVILDLWPQYCIGDIFPLIWGKLLLKYSSLDFHLIKWH